MCRGLCGIIRSPGTTPPSRFSCSTSSLPFRASASRSMTPTSLPRCWRTASRTYSRTTPRTSPATPRTSPSRRWCPDETQGRPAAVDALQPLAVQAQHAVEAAQLQPLDATVVAGQVLQHAHVRPDLRVQLAPHPPAEHPCPAARPDRVARLHVGEAGDRRLRFVHRPEEDVQPPA